MPYACGARHVTLGAGAVLLCLLAAACSSDAPTAPGEADAPQTDVPAAAGEVVKGTERLGWEVVAEPADAAVYRYFVFLDGQRAELAGASCEMTGPRTYACSAPLPPMAAGRHAVEVATLRSDTGRESARSNPVVIILEP